MKVNYGKAQGMGFIILILLLVFTFGGENKASAADMGTVTVKYLDQYNNNLKEPEVLQEEVGNSYNIPSTQIDGYTLGTLPANRIGTFTEEPIEVIFRYARNEAAVTSFGSLHFNSMASATSYNGNIGDYDGNIAFFKGITGEALTTSMTRRTTTMMPSGTMMSSFLYVPRDGGQHLTDFPDFKLYSGDSSSGSNFPDDEGLLLTSERIADAGYLTNIMYSTDGGTTFRPEDSIANIEDVNVVEYQLIRTRAAATNPLPVNNSNPLWIKNESPVGFKDSLLTAGQLSGEDSMAGWRFKLRNAGGTVNSPVKIYNTFPSINGTVKLNISELGIDWDTGVIIKNVKIKLMDNEGTVLGTTLTDDQGDFTFENIDSTKQLSLIIDESTETFFLDPTTHIPNQLVDNELLIGSLIEIGKASDTKSINWKSTVLTNPDALNATNGRFVITDEIEAGEAGPVTVRYVDENGADIAPALLLEGEIDETYETQAIDIPGYVLVNIPINAIGVFTDEEQTVIYIYESKGDNPGPSPGGGGNEPGGIISNVTPPKTGDGIGMNVAIAGLIISLSVIALSRRNSIK